METVLEIIEEEETRLVNALKSTLQTLPPFPTECCIYRVPYELRRVNEEAYTPMLVSIGPFHHGEERLQQMEVQKQRYLNDFLNRRPDLDLECYVRLLKQFEERARNCYVENIQCSSSDFIKMMLLDGCFIIEFFLKGMHIELRNSDDPKFKSTAMITGILRDMALLENQLPFFILVNLFNLNVGVKLHRGRSFLEIALNHMDSFIGNSEEWIELNEATYKAKHMVDLCVQYYTPTATGAELCPETARRRFRIPNASNLHDLGVKLKKNRLLNVTFSIRKGILKIPSVQFVDNTETFLRNLIAYEQCDHMGVTQLFSDYIFLMNCLIATPNDVELLTKAGIINNLLGDNGEVVQIFNKLSSDVKCDVKFRSDFYLHPLFENVNYYSNIQWRSWRAKLKRNPWRSISVGGTVLLILTVVQSVCSILQLKG